MSLSPSPAASKPPFLPFAVPDIGAEEIAEVVDTLKSGWITTGAKTRKFESDFSVVMGGAQSLAVNSATSGLHLVLEALGVGQGDEVITTTYTFTATAEVVRYLGAHPVFVDIDAATMNIDVAAIEARITPRTKAIIPVHFAGLSCDMDAIIEIARRHGIAVVEDAAHSLPTTYRGQMIGTLGTAATVFSFYATKTLATGEGGMIVTHDAKLAERCKIMRLHGISRDSFDRYTSIQPSWHYEVVAPGFKYNLTDMASSLGIHQLRRVYWMRERRAQLAAQFDAAFAGLPCILPPQAPGEDLHAWHLYVIRLGKKAPISRDAFIQEMADMGIGCSVHFIPLHRQPYWRDTYNLSGGQFPRAEEAYASAVSLPLYSRMTDEDCARVIEAVRKLLTV
jgi:dTDP-4-amino-4,6-dideoxygalactose transaminase